MRREMLGYFENIFLNWKKSFLKIYAVVSNENIIHYKCSRQADARLRRTCVISTENPCLWSKNPILVSKMLKNRKNWSRMAVSAL